MPLRGEMRQTLSPREREVLSLLAAGYTNKEIAARLHISIGTVKSHLDAASAILGTSNRVATVARALQRGIIAYPPEDT